MFSTFNSFNSQIQKKNIKISLIPSPQIWLKFLASDVSNNTSYIKNYGDNTYTGAFIPITNISTIIYTLVLSPYNYIYMAGDFAGYSDYGLPINTSINLSTTNSFTISLWFTYNSQAGVYPGDPRTIFSSKSTLLAPNYISVYVADNNKLILWYLNSVFFIPITQDTTDFYYLAWTKTSAGIHSYYLAGNQYTMPSLNLIPTGTVTGTQLSNASLPSITSTFSIGKNDYDWSARNFTGNIGDIRFFTTALTEEQLTYIYNNPI